MPSLLVPDLPMDLYRQIEKRSEAEHLPMDETVLRLLQNGLSQPATPPKKDQRTQQEILDNILRNRITPPPGTPDSVEMLREDRNR